MLKQIKKNHVEAPERHMTPEERAAFEEKGNEVKKLLLAKILRNCLSHSNLTPLK